MSAAEVAAAWGAADIRPNAPIAPHTPITVRVSSATPSTLPVSSSVAEAEDSSTSRMRFDFSSITLFSRMDAPVMTSDHSRKPAPRPMKVGRRSRNDTSPPLAALGEKAFTSGRKS